MNYGAAIISIKLPSNKNDLTDVVLGFDHLDGYLGKSVENPYFGVINGRVANRISNASFVLDGQTFNLSKNDQKFGESSVHGGFIGFDKVLWNAQVNLNSVTFSYFSKDGQEGYPGDLITNVTYELTEENELKIGQFSHQYLLKLPLDGQLDLSCLGSQLTHVQNS